jgi:hypothetical protein
MGTTERLQCVYEVERRPNLMKICESLQDKSGIYMSDVVYVYLSEHTIGIDVMNISWSNFVEVWSRLDLL